MRKYVYTPTGVCSAQYTFTMNNDVIDSIEIERGCQGNLEGISALLKGRKADEIISLFEGILCKERPTSCPDQIAQGLKQYLATEM